MSKLLLNIVMLFSGFWSALGADVNQMRIILQAKLTVDNRKPVSFGNNKGMQRKKKKDLKNSTLITMLLSFFMGLIYVVPILLTEQDMIIGLTLFYTIFIFFLTFTLITDFSNIIVDTKDKYILFPRPISDKTIMLTRIAYIGVYLLRLVIPMSLASWVAFGLLHGWLAAIWFPLPLLLCVFIVLFLVCGLYILMIRLAGAKRFQDVLNYFQIGFSVVFFAVWMLSSRMIDMEKIETLTIGMFDWVKYLPSYWLAASYSWIDSSVSLVAGTKWLSLLAIIFPAFSLWATVKWLAPHFAQSLLSGDEQHTTFERKKANSKKSKSKKRYLKIADAVSKDDTTKAGFIITWLQTARNRNFRMRVYPAIAYIPVYFVYILLSSNESLSDVWAALPEQKTYLILLYFTTFPIMQSLNYVTMSDQYKAAWVYYSTPVGSPGKLIAGAAKALWVKFFMPFMVLISIFVVYVWGAKAIIDVVLATINISLFIVLMMRFNYRLLPFSVKEQIKDSGVKTMLRVIIVMAVIGLLATGHYLASLMWWLKIIFIVLASILLWLLYDSLVNLPWSKIKTAED